MTSSLPAAADRPARGPELNREQVVLCGPDGTAIGTADKVGIHGRDTPLHLAFSCYVFDSAGRTLVTRRAYDKRTFPGLRTNTCCGHPGPGEPIEDAVRRRVHDELGLELEQITLILPRFRYRAVAADGVVENELCPVFRAVARDPQVLPNPVEVAAAWWVPWAEFASHSVDAEVDDDAADPLSKWGREQLVELARLGPDPMSWPAADPGELPSAARVAGPGS
jgi:isopentenyl-diphosphate Delta-isomerase